MMGMIACYPRPTMRRGAMNKGKGTRTNDTMNIVRDNNGTAAYVK